MCAILRLVFFILVMLPCCGQSLAPDCQQLILVISPDWNQPKARLQRFEKQTEKWVPVGQPIDAILGGSGLAWGLGDYARPPKGLHKKEGDNRSPAGTYRITQLWLRRGIPAPGVGSFPVHRIEKDTIGVDDPKSVYYNRILRSQEVQQPDWESWEKMDIADYDRVLVVAHNLDKPVPGGGSCIFIHRWAKRDKPTSGCTAMAESDLIEVIHWLRPASKPRLVQLTQTEALRWASQNAVPAQL